MKFALFYAAWDGEGWSTPIGIRNELESRGHEVCHYNLYHNDGELHPTKKIRHYSADCMNRFHFDYSRGYSPDVALVFDYGVWDCYQYDKKFFPDVLFVMEAGDEPQSHRQQISKAKKSHIVLSPDLQCVDRYKKMGIDAFFWTHHADHRLFYPRPEIIEEFGCVTTCGGRKYTEEIQRELGDLFNNERYFYGEDHAIRLNMGKMVFQSSQFSEITRRVFEGMACGKAVITDRLPPETGLQDMFSENREIIFYDNANDAIEKIRYYLDNSDERKKIAAAGHSKVMENHTCKQRVNELLNIINDFI